MLGVAALDPEAWAPARIWIVAFVVTRSAFAAWAASTRLTFHTGRVEELRGWILSSPLLAVAFAATVVASIGLPGLAAFEARSQLVELALDGPIAVLVLLGTLTPLAYYGRLVAVGVTRRPGIAPPERHPWRPVVGALDLTDLPAWSRSTWDANRALAATAVTILMGGLALAMAAGAFGVIESAAGLPPTVQDVSESFEPGVPGGSEAPGSSASPETSPGVEPSAEPSVEPSVGESPDASAPSFEPVPTPEPS
jgi:hypothetical protein